MKNKLFASLVVANLLAGGAGLAETSFMQVTGVPQGDTLNVRTGPGSGFPDIGDIQPGQVW